MACAPEPVFDVLENASARYTAKMVDETGSALPASSLNTMTLTLYDRSTETIINGRDGQNVLNANGVTLDANGNLAWTLAPADNPIVGASTARSTEEHIALFEWTYGSGQAGKHRVRLLVENLSQVP